MKCLLVVFVAIISWPAMALNAQLSAQIEYYYYPVTVSNAADVISLTELSKPFNPADYPKPGHTDWQINYTFNSVRKYGNNCQVSVYDVKASCAITLPEYHSDDVLLAYRLKSYAERLKVHELRHCEIVTDYAQRFENWLNSLRYYNCGDIMDSVRWQYNLFMNECEKAHFRYDRETDFGKIEGADLDLLLPRIQENSISEPSHETGRLAVEKPEADGDNKSGFRGEPNAPPEPMGNYYQDKDGVWRNDAR